MGSAGKGAARVGLAAMHSSSASRTPARPDMLLPSPPDASIHHHPAPQSPSACLPRRHALRGAPTAR
eukprot:8734060-Prorocentrum_lima.AAC.1